MTQEEILKLIKWDTYPPYPTGGQMCGKVHSGATLFVDEISFRVSIDWHRSQLKNKQECLDIFIKFCRDNKIIE